MNEQQYKDTSPLERMGEALRASREKSKHWYDLLRQYRRAVKLYDETRSDSAYGVKIIFDQFIDGIIEQTEAALKKYGQVIEPHDYINKEDNVPTRNDS